MPVRQLLILALFLISAAAQANTLELLEALPPSPADIEEPSIDRSYRLEVVAVSIDAAAEEHASSLAPVETRAYLISLGWWETRFALNVHQRRCRSTECDAHPRYIDGKLVVWHRARSPWQFQRWGYTAPVWDSYHGADIGSTMRAARLAAKVMIRGRLACGTPAGAFTYYATGGRCRSSKFDPAPRVATWNRLIFDIRRQGGIASRP